MSLSFDDVLKELAVVIPVAPGDNTWKRLLQDLRDLPQECEICLSSPQELRSEWERIKAQGWQGPKVDTVVARPGRGSQLNMGAQVATKKFLWFLHADSRLSGVTLKALGLALDEDPLALWFFRLQFLKDGPEWMRLNEWGADFRSRVLGLPFGDQGFCLQAETFHRLGGFPLAAYGEDHLFVWKARQRGVRVKGMRTPLFTSARKYAGQGWFRTTGQHLWLTAKQALPEVFKRGRERVL